MVERYGICNAITTYSGQDFSRNPEAKQHCIRALVRSLYGQLRERLQGRRRGPRRHRARRAVTSGDIVAAHPELFDEGAYHIDTSHLSSVCQFALELDPCPERKLARELCAYGEQLSDTFKFSSDPPFENTYADYKVLLDVLDGVNVEAGLKHFRDKIDPAAAEGSTFPAEVYVNLLLKLDRKAEVLQVAKKYLAGENRQLVLPRRVRAVPAGRRLRRAGGGGQDSRRRRQLPGRADRRESRP